jgi:CheY-like chemotaxis protein
MENDDLAQACNAFFRGRSASRAEAEGIGLGLAICKHMADLMQAQLQLASQPGQGTSVSIRLPVVQEQPASVPAAAAPRQEAPLDGLLVAVIENDRLAREALCAWLEDAGARVAWGGSLAQLQEALRAEGEGPDLVVADYRLAQGTGVQAIEAIRARHGAVPALIVSGEPDAVERAPGVPVLQKPVTPERLLEALRTLRPARRSLPADAQA